MFRSCIGDVSETFHLRFHDFFQHFGDSYLSVLDVSGRFLENIWMFRGCFGDVSLMFRGCFWDVSGM